MALTPVARCPRCRGGLVELSLTDLGELRCGACQGAWLDGAGTVAVGEQLGMRAATWRARVHKAGRPWFFALKCIRCHTALRRLRLRALDVDACAQCGGMWLDHGELERISQGRHADPAEGDVRRRALSTVLDEDPDAVLQVAALLSPPSLNLKATGTRVLLRAETRLQQGAEWLVTAMVTGLERLEAWNQQRRAARGEPLDPKP